MNKIICPGLDPDINKIPEVLVSKYGHEKSVLVFLKEIVDITSPLAAAYKIQKAFFDPLQNGSAYLQEIIEYIHTQSSDTPVYLDCKIGDIDNTMKVYLDYMLNVLKADGVVVNPYMGAEVLDAFRSFPNKTPIVLIRTSNPGAVVTQDLIIKDGRPYWEYILDWMLQNYPRAIPIIACSANLPNNVGVKLAKRTVFVAGFGSQGGTVSELSKIRQYGAQVLVNSSRALLYPYTSSDIDWKSKVSGAIEKMQEDIGCI